MAKFDNKTAGQKVARESFFIPINKTLASAMIGSDRHATKQMTLDRLSNDSSRETVASSLNRIAIGRPKVAPIQ